ncbi:signal peptidase I [Aquirhabdus parva]|uniref:Signal peptidase I n=1 Tax=Aquirhabdus parva TaxID=2283318 RepID=A0A345P639_9GAMM|nr:signal peptidase I [Aquirhabdus parva]AXI02748.1 signal peptidase I [Aquirhabdus parva]
MDFDFNLILVPATLIFFAIWLLDKLVLKQRKRVKSGEIATESMWVSWGYDFFPILALVLIVRSFIFEPFNIPSESMNPTLLTGDFILVNKFDYGVRLPITNTKILDSGEPKRGEVVVFRYPLNPSTNYIKRLVGLPGDKIVYDEGNLTINGEKVAKVALPDMGDPAYEQFSREQMGTHSHITRELSGVWSASQAPFVNSLNNGAFVASNGHHWEVTVPAKHYFMMGDNRDRSADSRFWGFVPEENLAGRAVYVWMHKEPGWHLPSFSRNGVIN